MPTWIGHLISGLIGAMATGFAMTYLLGGRLSNVEARVGAIEKSLEAEKDRTSERIYQVADMMKSILTTANEVLKQNTILITELRSARRDHDG